MILYQVQNQVYVIREEGWDLLSMISREERMTHFR
jgi:hypothetical protein